MFEIIGFLAVVIILAMISASGFIVGLNYLGDYGIGGVPNTWATRVITLICWGIIIYGWYLVYIHSPFTISMRS